MINWSILARIKARQQSLTPKAEKPVESKGKKLIMKDPDTGDIVDVFPSIDKAVEAGFSSPNIKAALKRGSKYKGHIWAEA